MNYRFQNLLGAPYRGGNVIISNNTHLISPVGNRISLTDLVKSETSTLPFQTSSNISKLAVSPDGVFLITVDENSRCLFINLRRRAVLHRITFKYPVACLKFSPDGAWIAVAAGKLVQIWRAPGFKKEFFPFELVKTFANCNDKVTALDWSPDSGYVLAGSKDLTVRRRFPQVTPKPFNVDFVFYHRLPPSSLTRSTLIFFSSNTATGASHRSTQIYPYPSIYRRKETNRVMAESLKAPPT